jgi:hypothetical protein
MLTGGLALIGLGVVFLVAQYIGWDRIWPLFPLLVGLAVLVSYLLSGLGDSGLVFLGVGAVLVGLFFFGFTLGYWEWSDMSRLWPVFVLIGGVAFLALFLADRKHDLGTLGVGCAAMIVGIVGLTVTFGLVTTDIVKLWPVLLILLGLFGLIGGLMRSRRQE